MVDHIDGFERHALNDRHGFFSGSLPSALRPDSAGFEKLWDLHPDAFHEILMHGRKVKTPRWQQAFGNDYHYTGNVNEAEPVPPLLESILGWSRTAIFEGLNGLLLNWYDGRLGHYIGAHHDSAKNMMADAPIVTISLGEERIFRLSHPKTKEARDFPAKDGTVFVMPFDTNKTWKHEVPRFVRWQGRRISITIRAFLA